MLYIKILLIVLFFELLFNLITHLIFKKDIISYLKLRHINKKLNVKDSRFQFSKEKDLDNFNKSNRKYYVINILLFIIEIILIILSIYLEVNKL